MRKRDTENPSESFGMEVVKVAQACVVVKKLKFSRGHKIPRCTITYPKNDLINFVNEILAKMDEMTPFSLAI